MSKKVIPGTGHYEALHDLKTRKVQDRATEGLIRLREQFRWPLERGGVPNRTLESKLLLATWNIREFGKSSKVKIRLPESFLYMAEILLHFDLIALQEVRDIEYVERVVDLMGPWWKYMITDLTEGQPGNQERLAYVYDSRKVEFDGLVGEIVLPDPRRSRFELRDKSLADLREDVADEVPPKVLKKLDAMNDKSFRTKKEFVQELWSRVAKRDIGYSKKRGAMNCKKFEELVLKHAKTIDRVRQIDRTPFISGFKSGFTRFQICTVHIHYGDGQNDDRRVEEVRVLAEFLKNRSEKYRADIILLGDMNIFRDTGRKKKKVPDKAMQALLDNEFAMPEKIRREASNAPTADTRQPFDQIAIKPAGPLFQDDLNHANAGVFDFFQSVFRDDQMKAYKPDVQYGEKMAMDAKYKAWRTFQMSDHLLKWVELETDFTDELLGILLRMPS